ncbi:MAG: acyl-CoA dehydrogenase family protein [Deltaproteobacteria bacterium]|nr:acyl-CoA dehydrogenase family protein [Deltaproteobacteria bacterium]
MDFTLTDDQKAFAEGFSRFIDSTIVPRGEQVDRDKVFPTDNYKALAEMGYLGLGMPEEYGGTPADSVVHYLAQEELARGCASTFLSSGASCGLFGVPVRLFASDEMKSEILPGLIKGDLVGAWALTEPHCGSDAAAMKTRARKTDKGWVLNGSKMFITNGNCADWVVVAAKTDPEAGYAGVSSFLVHKDTPGFSAGTSLEKMGCRGSPTSALFFEDCEIPDEWLLGQPGTGFIQAMQTLEFGRVGMAAFGVGIAAAALEESIKYAKERTAFGKPIIKFQPVHFKIADMRVLVDGARLLGLRASWMHGRGECPQSLFSAAKLFATEAAVKCTDMAVQVHGGYGYMAEYRVERLYRDARLGPIGEGSSEIQRRLIAQETLAMFA